MTVLSSLLVFGSNGFLASSKTLDSTWLGRSGSTEMPWMKVPAGMDAQMPLASNVGTWSGSGICGVATNMLEWNDVAMETFCEAELGFFWNWGQQPHTRSRPLCSENRFVPMIWGYGDGNGDSATSAARNYDILMGYNEPDLWAPPAYPGGDYLASGSFPQTFHCGSAQLARNWQQLVTNHRRSRPTGVIVSPAMADAVKGAASAGDYSRCDSAKQTHQSHMDACAGWLKCFKESVIKLPCGSTNCWDAIDVLQFHAYVYTASDLIEKVQSWEQTWEEDLKGENGRKKKSLWLTEWSRAGTTDSGDPDGEVAAFMQESIEYMLGSPYVSGWSWFSQNNKTFASFTIDGKPPDTDFWASDLIDESGRLTGIGKTYANLCKANA